MGGPLYEAQMQPFPLSLRIIVSRGRRHPSAQSLALITTLIQSGSIARFSRLTCCLPRKQRFLTTSGTRGASSRHPTHDHGDYPTALFIPSALGGAESRSSGWTKQGPNLRTLQGPGLPRGAKKRSSERMTQRLHLTSQVDAPYTADCLQLRTRQEWMSLSASD